MGQDSRLRLRKTSPPEIPTSTMEVELMQPKTAKAVNAAKPMEVELMQPKTAKAVNAAKPMEIPTSTISTMSSVTPSSHSNPASTPVQSKTDTGAASPTASGIEAIPVLFPIVSPSVTNRADYRIAKGPMGSWDPQKILIPEVEAKSRLRTTKDPSSANREKYRIAKECDVIRITQAGPMGPWDPPTLRIPSKIAEALSAIRTTAKAKATVVRFKIALDLNALGLMDSFPFCNQ